MKIVEKILKELESEYSGGVIEFEGGLVIRKKDYYENKYEIYHTSNPRGGNVPIMTISSVDLDVVMEMDEEYLKKRKKLENEGYKPRGKGLFTKKTPEGYRDVFLIWGK